MRLAQDGALEQVVMVNCDIRRGRAPEQRERLGDAVAAVLEETLDWPRGSTMNAASSGPSDVPALPPT